MTGGEAHFGFAAIPFCTKEKRPAEVTPHRPFKSNRLND